MLEALANEIGGIPDRLMNLGFYAERKRREVTRDDYARELAFYSQDEFRAHKRFLQVPETAPALLALGRKDFADGEQLLLRYASGYRPRNPEVAPRFDAHVANRDGYLLLWRHPRRRPDAVLPPLVLCVHGFRMGHPHRAMAMFRIQRLYERGLDVALFIQPHHWKRADSRFAQHFFIGEDVPLTIENVGQQVHDLHASFLALGELGYSRIGLIGGSLGGLAVALHATQSAAPSFGFAVVPAIRVDTHLDPAKSLLPFGKDPEVREQTFRALDVVDPTFYRPRMDLAHFGVVYHKGDRINAAAPTEAWLKQWQLQHVTALAGGHWLVFDNRARGEAWYGWLARHGF